MSWAHTLSNGKPGNSMLKSSSLSSNICSSRLVGALLSTNHNAHLITGSYLKWYHFAPRSRKTQLCHTFYEDYEQSKLNIWVAEDKWFFCVAKEIENMISGAELISQLPKVLWKLWHQLFVEAQILNWTEIPYCDQINNNHNQSLLHQRETYAEALMIRRINYCRISLNSNF